MPVVHFQSLAEADVIEIELVRPDSAVATRRLLVDSGFTGTSSLVLPRNHAPFARADAMSTTTSGALQGEQMRITAMTRIPQLGFQRLVFAILADVSGLSLPSGVDGLVGLRFLRQFDRWGAERDEAGAWRFFLAIREGD